MGPEVVQLENGSADRERNNAGSTQIKSPDGPQIVKTRDLQNGTHADPSSPPPERQDKSVGIRSSFVQIGVCSIMPKPNQNN